MGKIKGACMETHDRPHLALGLDTYAVSSNFLYLFSTLLKLLIFTDYLPSVYQENIICHTSVHHSILRLYTISVELPGF